ncbi:MAG TPA: hypothetical protein VGC62_04485 [Pseudomonas sp.]|uniref:hypothetical protein n=1 Tax=Pseudomonas sp. TaxID=306 RepID=UPI002ED8ECC9
MRDASVLLLVLILVYMGLDYVSSVWRGKGRQPKDVWLSLSTLAAYTLVIGSVVFLFGHNALFSLLAGAVVGVCWAVTRWLIARMTWGFAFALRYAINLTVLSAVWLTLEGDWMSVAGFSKGLASSRNLLVLLGYVLVLRPSSVLIGSILSPWLPSVNTQGSLKSAGKLIGYLERVLILTFVLLEQWEAIGFLLTAKSILRFNDIKGVEQRALSEYVLLGTLLSFTISIAIGLAVVKLSGV